MRTRTLAAGGLLSLSFLFLAACDNKPPPQDADAGPDVCNNKDDADSSADCTLVPGDPAKQFYVNFPGDQDWFSIHIPATISARNLVHVKGFYAAPNTAVNLGLTVLDSTTQHSLAAGVDRHGQAAPQPVNLLFRYTQPSTTLYVVAGDQPDNPSHPNFDARSPYNLQVELLDDPDTNEPNDTTPTNIPLTSAGNGIQSGTASGYLATNDDVDMFQIVVPSAPSSPRRILYLDVSAPALGAPPPPYRLYYQLLDSSGTRVFEATSGTDTSAAIDLPNAHLITTGTYKLVVQMYRPSGTSGSIPGDLRRQYTVTAKLMNEADATEPNDSYSTAHAYTLSTSQPQNITGRIDHVPDEDWFEIDLPANPSPTVIKYNLTVTNVGGRFPPIPNPNHTGLDREIALFKMVSDTTTCQTDSTACPKDVGANDALQGLVSDYCANYSPPRCLLSRRLEEDSNISALRNMQGEIPVPAHGSSALTYYFRVENYHAWADDLDYVLALSMTNDTDEQTADPRNGGTLVNDTGNTFPSVGTTLTGKITYGMGFLTANDPRPTSDQGIRGPDDYDAYATDQDTFVIDLPSLADISQGATWELQWAVDNVGTAPPAKLLVSVTFCDGLQSTSSCVPVSNHNGTPQPLAYTLAVGNGPSPSWWDDFSRITPQQPLYDVANANGKTTVTVRPYGCFCFEPRFLLGGKFYVKVSAIDRDTYDDINYTIRTALTSYPEQFAQADGGTMTCPPPGPIPDGGTATTPPFPDGGCNMSR